MIIVIDCADCTVKN